jgi:hypothetical protein
MLRRLLRLRPLVADDTISYASREKGGLMDRRRMGYLAVAIGAVLLVVSAAADPLGIGEGGGFGWKQVVGVIVGAAIAAAGGWLVYGRGRAG